MKLWKFRPGAKALQHHPVPILADAAIATEKIGNGKLIPVLILDTSERPDVAELIRIHAHLPQGDVISQ